MRPLTREQLLARLRTLLSAERCEEGPDLLKVIEKNLARENFDGRGYHDPYDRDLVAEELAREAIDAYPPPHAAPFIRAIKNYRERTGSGLKDSKDAIDRAAKLLGLCRCTGFPCSFHQRRP